MIIAVLTSSMLLTVLLIPALIKYAVPLKLVDLPNERKVHIHAIPRVGGIAMVLGVLLPLFVLMPEGSTKYGILAAFATIFLFGIWDDRGDLNYKLKFLGQFLASIFVVVIGDVSIRWVPFLDATPLPDWISFPVTIFCLLAITNAIAISDGLDGLTGGSSLLSFIMLGALAFVAEDMLSIIIAISVIGSILGFLRYNAHPAIIFMGDTGSQFLGFSLGTVSILLTQHTYTAISPVFPVLLLGSPIIDTAWVMISRVMAGTSPFKADKNHIHHRLLSLGLTHFEVVVLIYLTHIIFISSAFYFRFAADVYLLFVFVTITAAVVGGLFALQRTTWQKNNKVLSHDVNKNTIIIFVNNFLVRQAIKKTYYCTEKIFSSNITYLFIPLLLFCLSLNLNNLEIDLFILCILLFLASFCALIFSGKNLQFDKVSMYVFAALIAYLSYKKGYINDNIKYFDFIYMACLGVLLFFYIVFIYKQGMENKQFKINPTDILIALLVLILPLLTLVYHENLFITIAMVKFVIFIYLFEIVLVEQRNVKSVQFFITLLMGIVSVKTLFG